MSFIVPEEIEAYAAARTTPPEELLAELAEETKSTLRSPQMLTGPIEGRLLELLVHGIKAKRVLELGTYSGYSSLSMAAGLAEGGHIDTCEVDEKHAATSRAAHTPIGSPSTSARRWRRSSSSVESSTSSSSTQTRRITAPITTRCCRGSRRTG
jgi:predicted O-methyltransferase YrrM